MALESISADEAYHSEAWLSLLASGRLGSATCQSRRQLLFGVFSVNFWFFVLMGSPSTIAQDDHLLTHLGCQCKAQHLMGACAAGEAQNEVPAKINGPLKKVWRRYQEDMAAQQPQQAPPSNSEPVAS